MEIEEHRQLKRDALKLIEDPAYPRLHGALREHYVRAIEKSQHEEQALREHCFHMLRAVDDLHRLLTGLGRSGKLEAVKLARSNGGVGSAA